MGEAFVDSHRKRLGCGIIVRDHGGFVIAAQCSGLDVIQEPVIAEALVSLIAAEFGWDLGLSDIILEGDSLQVVQAFRETRLNYRPYGQTVDPLNAFGVGWFLMLSGKQT